MNKPNSILNLLEKENNSLEDMSFLHNTNNTKWFEFYNQKYFELFNSMPFPLFTYYANGDFFAVNHAGKKIFQLINKDVKKYNIKNYIEDNSHAVFLSHCQSVLGSNKHQSCELNFLKNENFTQLKMISFAHKNENEECIITSFFHEIENYDMVNYSKNSYDLDMVMLNNINQKLTIIGNYINGSIHYLEKNGVSNKKIVDTLQKSLVQSDSINEILFWMKGFTFDEIDNIESISIKNLIQEISDLINYETYGIPTNIHYYFTKSMPDVLVNKAYIQQVILCLVRNSLESMRDAKVSSAKLIIETNQLSSDYIEVCVNDNGPGISASDFTKIFSPYFTTKKYGIGLGLPTCQAILKTHNSELRAENNIFGGACFKFNLPICSRIN